MRRLTVIVRPSARSADGSFNSLDHPRMGMARSRFGRNFPLPECAAERGDDLLDPNPRVISRELLARRTFIPATTLNLLAAAWIQFETHNWFSHGVPQPGDVIALYATGMEGVSKATVRIGNTDMDADSIDKVPGLPGLWLLSVTVPRGEAGNATGLSITGRMANEVTVSSNQIQIAIEEPGR